MGSCTGTIIMSAILCKAFFHDETNKKNTIVLLTNKVWLGLTDFFKFPITVYTINCTVYTNPPAVLRSCVREYRSNL